jgi:hypothetical protein
LAVLDQRIRRFARPRGTIAGQRPIIADKPMNLRQTYLKRWEQMHTTRMRLWLGCLCAAIALLFVLALHPLSGFIGGLFIVFLGWAVPSVLNVLASIFVFACLPRKLGNRPLATLIIAIAASFLLAVMPAMPTIIEVFLRPPIVTSTVARVVTVPKGTMNFMSVSSPSLDVVVNPFASLIGMGSNEGCGCSYWTVGDSSGSVFNSYHELLTEDLVRHTGGSESPQATAPTLENLRNPLLPVNPLVSLAVIKTADRRDPDREDITISVMECRKITAEFHEFSVPAYPQEFMTLNGKPLSSGPFLEIAWHDLTHDTFWSWILGTRLGYYPRSQIRQFLRHAIVVGGNPDPTASPSVPTPFVQSQFVRERCQELGQR